MLAPKARENLSPVVKQSLLNCGRIFPKIARSSPIDLLINPQNQKVVAVAPQDFPEDDGRHDIEVGGVNLTYSGPWSFWHGYRETQSELFTKTES